MITDKIEKTIEKYHMLTPGDSVAVGVSGGADSMLLLQFLTERREKYGITVIAAHVEHGIRGEASLADAAFVRNWCVKNGVDFRQLSLEAPVQARMEGRGVEEYSRERRYAFFRSLGCSKIATAHSLSDNVETVLFRLARGTANRGMCGIPPVRENIIRPLLECTASEIRAYCKETGIPYRVDETNLTGENARSYIRNEIVPLFEKLNPSFETAVARSITAAREDEAALSALAAQYSGSVADCLSLKKEPPAVAKRVLLIMAMIYGVYLDEKHLAQAYSLLFNKGRIQLKGSLFAVCDGKTLEIKHITEKLAVKPKYYPEELLLDSSTFNENQAVLKKQFAFYCDYDKIVGSVSVRSRREGDRITLAGRGCSKSLKKLMNELKLPPQEREACPVITDGAGVIGVYGYALAERVAVSKYTSKIYLLKISMEDFD